ncbi:hypothetical protein CCR75_001387 [Bremia lactucae]|uniref:Protein BIG1 n=1 Tax=Bremia lactucae TaxID=4779 RepID=A0A976IFC7_BRELC|nr:hypothetical protein CCR75_001387 [Bremia lactucae]
MKPSLQVALYGLACAAPNVTAETLISHVPLLMWSQRTIFAGSNVYLGYNMDEVSVASAVKRVLRYNANTDKEGLLSTEALQYQQAELMCLFLLPSLASNQMSQFSSEGNSYVQHAVQSAVSSVVLPHTTRLKPLLPELSSAEPHVVGAQDLSLFVASTEGKELLVNGKTDLLVVQMPELMSLPDVDAAILKACSTLEAATGEYVDFAFTGNDASSVQIQDPLARRLAASTKAKHTNITDKTSMTCEVGYLLGSSAKSNDFCFSHYVSITPDIMAGLLIGLMFVTLSYIGLSVLHQIQIPQRYPSRGAPRGKEF